MAELKKRKAELVELNKEEIGIAIESVIKEFPINSGISNILGIDETLEILNDEGIADALNETNKLFDKLEEIEKSAGIPQNILLKLSDELSDAELDILVNELTKTNLNISRDTAREYTRLYREAKSAFDNIPSDKLLAGISGDAGGKLQEMVRGKGMGDMTPSHLLANYLLAIQRKTSIAEGETPGAVDITGLEEIKGLEKRETDLSDEVDVLKKKIKDDEEKIPGPEGSSGLIYTLKQEIGDGERKLEQLKGMGLSGDVSNETEKLEKLKRIYGKIQAGREAYKLVERKAGLYEQSGKFYSTIGDTGKEIEQCNKASDEYDRIGDYFKSDSARLTPVARKTRAE
ncbi:MAG: hypothetical protein KAQ85_10195, partial [Thermodesulfovibrionia bacterium]|nr:hypothetical protein [Thermodesulfovibrionia bacterium]